MTSSRHGARAWTVSMTDLLFVSVVLVSFAALALLVRWLDRP